MLNDDMNFSAWSETLLLENAKGLGRVAVVMGGNSAERPVSLKSGAAVYQAFQNAGADVFCIDLYGPDGNLNPVAQLTEQPIDLAFIILHGRGGEDGVIQGTLQMLAIPYTGSGVAGSALAMDKWRSKHLFNDNGLATPPYVKVSSVEQLSHIAQQLGYPMMVKAAHEGSSIGMYKVSNLAEFETAFKAAAEFDSSIIAEQWMTGSEFTVAILGRQALPIIKLETPHDFYDYNAKYEADDTSYDFAHGLTQAQIEQVNSLSLAAFTALGCEGWGRADLMQDAQGEFRLLEVNTAPGMTDHSLVPMAAQEAGLSFEQLVVSIAQQAKGA